MGLLRLYRKFYCVSTFDTSDIYTLINPTSLSAATYIAGDNGNESTTLIESDIDITEEEKGIFYADLNSELYASDVSYDLVFYVQYTPMAPLNKKLSRRFRIKTTNITRVIDYELGDTTTISIEILDNNNNVIDVEIISGEVDIDLLNQEVNHYINNNNGNGPIDIEIN